MKLIFDGDIHSIATDGGNLVAAIIGERYDTQARIFYKAVAFDNAKVTLVPPDLFKLAKFGSNYKDITKRVHNHLLTKSVILENGKVFCTDVDGTAYLFDSDGGLLWKGELVYRGCKPTGLAVCSRHLWVAFGELNVIMRMNLATMREELRLGGGKESPFINPTDLFANGDKIYVCTKDSTEILAVNTNTYSIETYRTFEQPVRQYLRTDRYEFALLTDGVYIL
ncbi:MAG: hypothetical protein IKK13_02110 [Clostridia bacterium]|nr:hypothetical protein [Clostridia bacterium]